MFKGIVRGLINAAGYDLVRVNRQKFITSEFALPSDFEEESTKFISLVSGKTMTSPERLNSLIGATKYISSNNIEGAIVECGVWRGGSMMTVAYTLQGLSSTNRDLYLFDTYEGMPPPSEKDITFFNVYANSLLNSADEKQREAYVCYSSLEDVKRNLYSTGYPKQKIHFLPGKVEDTIPEQAPEKIALLRLDTDWYESTRHELEHLFPRLAVGGVIIIDDYGYWKGCKEATDEYIEAQKIPLLLNRIDMTGRIGVKLS